MAIFLVQHGLSLPKDKDPEKGLSETGIEQTRLIASVAKNYEIPVQVIWHSGLKRAEQTAKIFQDTLQIEKPNESMPGMMPLDDVTIFANKLHASENIMAVGHLPFMGKLVSHLTTGNLELEVYRFQNSGIVCLDCNDDSWFIKWTLNPNIS